MTSHGIPPSGSSYSIPASQQSPQESRRMLEIQFETSVLGIFVSVTGQTNSPIQRQISQVKNGISTGQPTDQLASSLNQIVMQVNQTVIPGKAPFPSFQFSEGSQVQAMTNHAVTLEKCLNTLSEKGQFPWQNEANLFAQLAATINTMSQITPSQAYSQLNGVITQANKSLAPQYQIPSLPQA